MTIVCGQQNKFYIGIEGGPGLSHLRYIDPVEKNAMTFGFSGGLFFQYNFPKIFSIRTNIAFERKSSRDQLTITSSGYDQYSIVKTTANLNYDYLVMPVLFKATFGKKINYFINAGPYFGYLLSQEFKYVYYDLHNNFNQTASDKRYDIGLTAGLGISIPIKDRYLISCEIRNNLGLIDINNTSYPYYPLSKTKTNSTNLQFGVAYKLGTRPKETKG